MIRMLLATTILGFGLVASAETVTVYSYRQPELIAPLLDAFSAESGHDVEAVFLKKGMIERVRTTRLVEQPAAGVANVLRKAG